MVAGGGMDSPVGRRHSGSGVLGTVRVLGFAGDCSCRVILVTEQDKFSVDNQVKLLFGSVCPPLFLSSLIL